MELSLTYVHTIRTKMLILHKWRLRSLHAILYSGSVYLAAALVACYDSAHTYLLYVIEFH